MAGFNLPFVANVAEPGDVALYAVVLALTLAVGLALFGMDSAVGRLKEKRQDRRASSRRAQERAD